ncbi:hypothetical protein D7V93_14715 [Corallococcus llansteffanensis]|uniref:Uncharacterized protein n=2 Tax=Corallococcus llansteffanensis TaxID=2316731 RepID=A0A3A8PU87_9BACT|nr:hypothetical protein D7V93_14715 [Corallococcus llansteffanensis]
MVVFYLYHVCLWAELGPEDVRSGLDRDGPLWLHEFDFDNQNQLEIAMLGQGCCRAVLAQSPCAEVTRCSCGHIHLAVGPVTLRLEEDVLRALGHTLLEAIHQLEAASTATAHGASDDRWKQ